MRHTLFLWTRGLRGRLTLASVTVVTVALLLASLSLGWILQRQLIAKLRERDQLRAVQEVATAVYRNRSPVLFSLLDLPALDAGSVVQLVESGEKVLYDSRDRTPTPNRELPRLLMLASEILPPSTGIAAQRDFEEAFLELESCLSEQGVDPRALKIPLLQPNQGSLPLLQVHVAHQALELCLPGPREFFARASKGFAARAAPSEITAALDGNRSLRTGAVMLRPDGETLVAAVVVTPLRDVDRRMRALRNGQLIGIPLLVSLVGVVSWWIVGKSLKPVEEMRREVDVIAHSTLDRRVPEPQVSDEVGRLARTMNGMLDRLERAARAQRQFVSDASHELRSPLTSIRAQLEIALAHPDHTDWKAIVADTLDESLRMQRLVDELLELARMDEQEPDAYLGATAILDLDDIVFSEARRIDGKRVRTEGVSAGRVRGNPEQLRRVLRNLLENAVRYAREEIRVGLESIPGHVALVVEDDGPGISVRERERVFDRFARAEESRSRKEGGAGLGLAVVQGIVVRHGGHVALSRSTMGGARFEVALPAVDGQAPTEEAASV